MSAGNTLVQQRSGSEGTPGSGTPLSDLEVVRGTGPLAMRPLNSAAPTQQPTVAAKEAGPVVPAIRADDSESTDKEEVLRVKLAERMAEPYRRNRPVPQLRNEEEDEEVEETGETEETVVEGRTGEEGDEGETQETGEAEEVGGADQACPSGRVGRKRRRKENQVVLNAVNIAVRSEVSYLASTMTTEDLDWLEAMNGEADIVWRLLNHEDVACLDVSPEVCLYEHMFF